MNEYPPEVQAVLDAAAAWAADVAVTGDKGADLLDAVDAYRKSIEPPEPFEGWANIFPDGSWHVDTEDDGHDPGFGGVRWRCTITPIERVR